MNPSHQTPQRFFHKREKDDQSGPAHRQLIGITGILLPFLLWLIAGLRPLEGVPPWKPLGSISAYYYTGAVSAFAGTLIALAIFLFSYRGYNNDRGHWDRILALVAGIAAILVALFPTDAPHNLTTPPWWTPASKIIHYVSAGFLLLSLALFSLTQFPRTSPETSEPDDPDKKKRNLGYYVFGTTILLCIIWILMGLARGTPIFLPETVAFITFGLSWLIKGRIDTTLRLVFTHRRRP